MDYSGIICISIRVLCITLGRVCLIVYLSKIDDYFHYNETICIGFKITYMVFRLPIKKDHLAVVPSSVAFLGEFFLLRLHHMISCTLLRLIYNSYKLLPWIILKKHARDDKNLRNHGNQVLLNAPNHNRVQILTWLKRWWGKLSFKWSALNQK